MSQIISYSQKLEQDTQLNQPWNENELVEFLENASLEDVMKWMNVSPVKASISIRRGRFMSPNLAEALERVNIASAREKGFIVPEISTWPDYVMPLMETYFKLKVVEKIQKVQKAAQNLIEVNMAPKAVFDHLEELTTQHFSTFNLVDLGIVADKYLLWRRTMPSIQPFYAVKSNPDLMICNALNAMGTGFDCASKAELMQVLTLPNINTDDIIFANPCKQIEHILYAKEHNVSMMTFDNMSELEKIYEHFPSARLVLRLLPDDSHSLMPFGSKFGASFSESQALMARCQQLGMTLIGVSFHVGSGCYSPIAWVEALKLARSVVDEALLYGFNMTLVDMGGGYPGVETGEMSLVSIGSCVNPIVQELFGPEFRVIAEPGRFFCTQSTTLACVVVSKRERFVSSAGEQPELESQLYLADGIYGSMNCIVFDHAIAQPKLLAQDSNSRTELKTTMWGPTCDSIDVIVKGFPFPSTHVGEWIYFENMGAYTSAAASSFNGFAPPVSVYTANVFSQ